MLKKIITLALFAALVGAIGIGTNSCGTTEPNEIDTVRLISVPLNPFTGTLTRADSSGSFAVGQTCGCPFNYTVTAYGGDTNIIHFTVNDSAQSLTTHTIPTAFYPSSLLLSSDTVVAWIALYYLHGEDPPNPGIPLYDTIRVTAIY
jgi:hypothetical protein